MNTPDSNRVQVVPIPAFNDNYIWCMYDATIRCAVVVDPGDAGPVIDFLDSRNLQLVAILVTHHHADHTYGVKKLAQSFHCPVYASASEHSNFRDFDQPCHEGDSIELLGIHFNVIEVPGHTLDHIAFFSDASTQHHLPWLFCGDTLFSAGCGRIFNGTAALLYQALCKINTLPDDTQIFCTHEYTLDNLKFATLYLSGNDVSSSNNELSSNEDVMRYTQRCLDLRAGNLPTLPTTLHQERLINPFLRLKDSHLLARLGMLATEDETTIFTRLRAERDQFSSVLKAQNGL